jgi:ADP-ribosyl-[dinitrogen reductase] hydrolase
MGTQPDEWRMRGGLLGLAVGDALGAPFEGSSPTEAARAVEEGRADMSGGGRGWQPGESTDDTAMALLLAESIAERGLLDTDDLARRYIAWADTGPRGIGSITRAALQGATNADDARAKAKACHEQSGLTAGNGTVMRATPIGLAASSYEEATNAAREDAQLTHFDSVAGSSSAALCAALVAIRQDQDPLAAAAAETANQPKLEQVLEAVIDGREEPIRSLAGSAEGATCWATLGVALFALKTFDAYEPGVLWAIGLGVDTDTNAAVAGALLGARLGPDSIPESWLTPLRERERVERAASAFAERSERLS